MRDTSRHIPPGRIALCSHKPRHVIECNDNAVLCVPSDADIKVQGVSVLTDQIDLLFRGLIASTRCSGHDVVKDWCGV